MIYFLLFITTVNAFPSYPGLKGCSLSSKFPPIDGQRPNGHAYFNASFHTEYKNMCDDLPNPRVISNLLGKQVKKGNADNISAAWIYMGQFIDHDITLTPTGDVSMNIELDHYDELYSINDGWFNFSRSVMFSKNTAYLDLSSVYGDTLERSQKLRTFKDGLLISHDDFLPKNNIINLDMANNNEHSYACGDVRCNENTILIGYHYLFHNEHNRLAKEYKKSYPYYSDEHIFQLARLHNMLQYQQIVYEEWLPLLIGQEPVNWESYKELYPNDFFSTVAFRFGHSAIPNHLLYNGEKQNLFDHFFKPHKVNASNINAYMKGITEVEQEEVDLEMVESLRNKMFQNEQQSLDLFSLNVQRGRDHELLAFDKYYKHFTGIELTSFDQLTQNKTISNFLEMIYGSVECIDPFVGILAEDHANDSIAGLLIKNVVRDQFERTAAADKYFYKHYPSNEYKTLTELFNIHFGLNKTNVFKTQ